MSKEIILSTIVSLCHTVELNAEHISRRDHTENNLRWLRKAIDDYFEAAKDEPPTLGIHVGEITAPEDRIG